MSQWILVLYIAKSMDFVPVVVPDKHTCFDMLKSNEEAVYCMPLEA